MPRHPQLEKEVSRIIEELRLLGFPTEITETEDSESCIILSLKNSLAVLIGRVEINGVYVIASYEVNVYKWKWAELEGFSRSQICGELGNDIFKLIETKDITFYLSGKLP